MSGGDVVIVGGGPAGHRLAEQLRHHGHDGAVTVLDAGPGPAHQRALLPSVLDGSLPPDAAELPPLPAGVRHERGVAVTGVDRARRRVRTTAGEHRYDTLVLATGARPKLPRLPGLRAPGVTGLRSPADCAAAGGEQAVVLGGGPLGVEAAAALRRAGREVTLVHRGPHPMHRLLDATAGGLLAGHLAGLGVRVECGRRAVRAEQGKLVLDDGRVLPWDALVCCTGVRPRTGLARAAGLAVRTGVVVDERLCTEDPRIRAVGGCAEPAGPGPRPLGAGWEQAEALARLLTGRAAAPPQRAVLRPRLPGLALGVLGPRRARGHEVVAFHDPERGRYARLSVDAAGHLAHAVVVGLPRALAALTQLHDAGRPLPGDRLALLLGEARTYAALPPGDAVLCHCNGVTEDALAGAWRGGARTPRALAAATRATTGCGTCADALRDLCARLAAARPAEEGADPRP
ncbi:FAD-dependent oxidoreductase [Streptomyces capparidis]